MRIDMNPTDTYGDFEIRPGLFLENDASIVPGGVNFTIHSTGAKSLFSSSVSFARERTFCRHSLSRKLSHR